MPRLIDEDKAKEVLTDYYHISTDIQRIALEEAFSRIPTVEASDIFNKGLLTGLKAAGKNAIPKEWIKKWDADKNKNFYDCCRLLIDNFNENDVKRIIYKIMPPYNTVQALVEDWEKENAAD